MAGYTSSFLSVDGELISANLFTQEYAALDTAFDATGGHTHDGTAANGALIAKISDTVNEVLCGTAKISLSTDVGAVKTLQLTVEDGAILPAVTADIDLGSAVLLFKDGYLTTLTLGATTAVDAILDDATMTANSATALVTQASVVTYIPAVIADSVIDGSSGNDYL